MKRHVATVHEERKQIECDICNVKFTLKQMMIHHVAVVHEGNKQFNCDICNTNFGQKGNLKRHVAMVHEEVNNLTFVMLNLHQNR